MRIVATARFINTDIGPEENRVNAMMESHPLGIDITPSETPQVQTMQTPTPPSRRIEVRPSAHTPSNEVVSCPMGDTVHSRR